MQAKARGEGARGLVVLNSATTPGRGEEREGVEGRCQACYLCLKTQRNTRAST